MSKITVKEVANHLSELSVLDMVNLVKLLEEEWNVSASAPVAMAPVASTEVKSAEEKTEFNVILTAFGEKKINVIKEVRAITGQGLAEAKSFVESPPSVIKEGIAKGEAEKFKQQLEAAGATVELE